MSNTNPFRYKYPIAAVAGILSMCCCFQLWNTSNTNPVVLRSGLGDAGEQLHRSLGTGESSKLVLPNILLIGAQKAGTSTLAKWMFEEGVCHAQILKGEPKFYEKEVHYFDLDQRYKKGVDFYNRHFQHCYKNNKNFIMDATPDYIKAPDKVYAVYKDDPNLADLKIIFIVREPLARELSIFNHVRVDCSDRSIPSRCANWEKWVAVKEVDGREQLKTFTEFAHSVLLEDYRKRLQSYSPLGGSFSQAHYAMYLRRWFELFDPKQILVLSYEEDVKPGSPAKERVREFMNHPSTAPETPFGKAENTHESPYKVARVPCEIKDTLYSYLEPWNEELYELLASHERPSMERKPFPKFEPITNCAPDESDVVVDILG